jgi:hypothetical protein
MQRCGIAAAVVAFLAVAALPPAAAQDGDQYIKVEIKGTLKTGVVATEAETTGTVITIKTKGDLEVTWELDLGNNAEFIAVAKKLDNKTALATGIYHKKKGVEMPERHIVTVTGLTAPGGK